MTNQRAGVLAAAIMACGVSGLAGDANDKMTMLATHPGLTFSQEVDSAVCGRPAKINLYNAPFTSTMAEYLSWYKAQLKGFHYVHMHWDDRDQESFYSPDGTKGITLTGVPSGSRVFAVSYVSVSPGLTIHQMDTFSPSNPSCK